MAVYIRKLRIEKMNHFTQITDLQLAITRLCDMTVKFRV